MWFVFQSNKTAKNASYAQYTRTFAKDFSHKPERKTQIQKDSYYKRESFNSLYALGVRVYLFLKSVL